MDGLRAEMRWERAGIRRVSRDSTGAVRMPIWNTTIMCLAFFFWGPLPRALWRLSTPGLSCLEAAQIRNYRNEL